MGADEAICIDSDEEKSATGNTAHVEQSSKVATVRLDLCVDSDDEDHAISQAPVVFVLPSSGQPSGAAVARAAVERSAVAPLQANAAKPSPRKRKIAKTVDLCVDSDNELVGSDDDGDEAFESTSGLLPMVEQRAELVKVHSSICEAITMEKHTVMPAPTASKSAPCSMIETAMRSFPEAPAPFPTPIGRAVDISCTPVCVDTEPAKEIQHKCVGSVLSHQSAAMNGLDVVSEDTNAQLERKAQAMANKVLEKLPLTTEARAIRILKVKDGIMKRLRLQQSVDGNSELVGLAADPPVNQPPPPLVEVPSVLPFSSIAKQLKPEDIQVSTKNVSQHAVSALGFRDILALAEAQSQAFVERATGSRTNRPPIDPLPTLKNEVQMGFASEAQESRELRKPETGDQVEPRERRHHQSLPKPSGRYLALSGKVQASQAPSFAKRNGLRRLGKTRAERATQEVTRLASGRRPERPPPAPSPTKRRELRESRSARESVHAAEAEEDLESTFAFREAEREKRRALLGGSQERPAQAPSANGWEHRRLGSSAEKRKFLRLMGGSKLAGGDGADGSCSPLHDADLPTDCPTIELGAEGDWVPVAEGGPEGEGNNHREAGDAGLRAELEQMFERGLKQTWNRGRGLGA